MRRPLTVERATVQTSRFPVYTQFNANVGVRRHEKRWIAYNCFQRLLENLDKDVQSLSLLALPIPATCGFVKPLMNTRSLLV